MLLSQMEVLFKEPESKPLLQRIFSLPLSSEVACPTGNINYSDRLFSFVGIDLRFEYLQYVRKHVP